MKRCADCGSEKIIKEAKTVITDNSRIEIAIDEQPDALIFKQRTTDNVRAEICADCGYIAFYAANPKILWSAYQRRKKNV